MVCITSIVARTALFASFQCLLALSHMTDAVHRDAIQKKNKV